MFLQTPRSCPTSFLFLQGLCSSKRISVGNLVFSSISCLIVWENYRSQNEILRSLNDFCCLKPILALGLHLSRIPRKQVSRVWQRLESINRQSNLNLFIQGFNPAEALLLKPPRLAIDPTDLTVSISKAEKARAQQLK